MKPTYDVTPKLGTDEWNRVRRESTPDDVVTGAAPGVRMVAETVQALKLTCSACGQHGVFSADEDPMRYAEEHLHVRHPASRDPAVTCHAESVSGGWCTRPKGHIGDHWTPSHAAEGFSWRNRGDA